MMLDVAAYLARIGHGGPVQPDWATLRALHLAHLRTVPFENLDIHLGHFIRLDRGHLFQKIVRQRRGGFCYELNGLFAMLLREIGYTVTLLGAQFPRDDDLPAPELDHLALLVQCRDRVYPVLADVAAGRGSFPTPLRIDTGETQPQPEVNAAFRVLPERDGYRVWRQPHGGEWVREYRFDLQARAFAEFQAGCDFHQTSPHSPFTQNRLCTILTPTGRVTLSGNTLTATVHGVRSARELDEVGHGQALRDYFGITLDLALDPADTQREEIFAMNTNGTPPAAPLRVLGIGGSTRQGSTSLTLLRGALRTVEEAGATATLADVRALDLPVFNDDRPLEDYPASLHELLTAAREADAYILCSPTYHGTVSGAVKNALDALNVLGDDTPPYFGGKPVALMAVGGGGAANVLTSLQHAARAMNGVAIPTTVISSGSVLRQGEIGDEMVQRRVSWMVNELLDIAARLRQPQDALLPATRA